MRLFRYADENVSRVVLAGWQRPSSLALAFVCLFGAALSSMEAAGFIVMLVPVPLLCAAFLGIAYACARLRATEGALLVGGALAFGAFVFESVVAVFRVPSDQAWWARPCFSAGVLFFLGLAVAPIVVSLSQRRSSALHGSL